MLQLTGMLPFVGQLWWLLLASAVDTQDEYQLCNFLVGLRCQVSGVTPPLTVV